MDEIPNDWQPYCGAEFGRSLSGLALGTVAEWARRSDIGEAMVSGDPVICDLPPHKTSGKYAHKHKNSELNFEWW